MKEVKKHMNKYLTLLLLAGMVIAMAMGSVSAADTYVNATLTTGTHTGESWENAFNTIQEGIAGVTTNGTVFLAAGNYNGTGNKDMDVSKSFTLQGAGRENTIIDAENTNNILDIYDGIITIKDLTIRNGYEDGWGGAIGNLGTLNIINCNFENNQATDGGGAICNIGTLEVKNSNFSNNNALNSGGAIYNGEIYLFPGQQGTLTVNNCAFTDNHAGAGGAVSNQYSTSIKDSKFANNYATNLMGGAIYNSGTMDIINSIFDDNYAHDGLGGAAHNSNTGILNVEKSTFQNNYAHSNMGAGGAILNWGTATITGSTFKNNAAYIGGAIYSGGTLKVTGSTIDGNEAVQRNEQRLGGGIYLAGGSFEIISNHILNNIGSGIYMASFVNTFSVLISNGILKQLINFNRFYGNAPYGIEIQEYELESTINPILNATLNWWGSNAGPNGAGADKTNLASSLYTPWIVMGFSPTQVTLNGGSTTTIVANFLYDNIGGYHDPINGHIPDGTPVTFTTTLGQVGSQSITKYTVNGVATAILKAWNAAGDPVWGTAFLTATTDAQTLSSSVTILEVPTANAASKTVEMQETGLPVAGLILAVLAVFGGLFAPKRK